MRQLGAEAESALERTRCAKMELDLVLAEATDRWLGSIRQLQWEDIDAARSTIRWHGEEGRKVRDAAVASPKR